MTLQNRYETLKHAVKVGLKNYDRNTLGMNEAEKAHYTELWFQASMDWIRNLEDADKEREQ